LNISRHLGGLWPLLYSLIIIPNFITDAVYDFIARNRYRWFGKKESCMIPTPELQSKFL
jgi:predicted DCC family thiol-disulfide oxidoreductase YuxK